MNCRLQTYETAKKHNWTHVDTVNEINTVHSRKKRCIAIRIDEETSYCNHRESTIFNTVVEYDKTRRQLLPHYVTLPKIMHSVKHWPIYDTHENLRSRKCK
jgi:hypothetical protein